MGLRRFRLWNRSGTCARSFGGARAEVPCRWSRRSSTGRLLAVRGGRVLFALRRDLQCEWPAAARLLAPQAGLLEHLLPVDGADEVALVAAVVVGCPRKRDGLAGRCRPGAQNPD